MAISRLQLEAFTNKKIIPRLADAVFKGSPFAYMLKENHALRLDGGRAINFPVILKKSNTEWYSGADSATLEVLEQFTSAEFDWKWLRAPYALAEDDIDKNDSDEGIVNLLEAVEETAKLSVIEALSDGLFGTNASASKQMDGLQNMFGATGTSYGGLLDTDFTSPASWLSGILTLNTAGTLTQGEMRELRGSVTRGNSKPNLGLCNFPVYNKIWNFTEADQRFGMEKAASMGFDNVLFENMPILPDEHSPGSGYGSQTNWLMFLNMDYIQFWIHRNKAFLSRVYQPIPQQEVYIGKILLGCNLSTNNRRMHSVIKTIDPDL